MQTTSETWKSLWANGNAWLETKAIIAGVEYTDISAPAINRAAMQGGLGVGNAVSASLSLAVRTTDDIPKSAPVEILMRLTDGTTSSEWLPAGMFYISKRARDPVAGVQSFECYDALLKGNAALDEVPWTTEDGEQITTEDDVPIMFNASYPRDMASLVTDIAIMLGVELDARTVINTGAEYVVSNPVAGSTIRDLLGIVAAAHGGNWIITPGGKLRLVPVISASGAAAATEDVADIVGTVGSIYVGDSAIISGVRYTAGEAEPVLIGDETGVIIDVSLPYALAHNLAQALIGTAYQPYTMSGAIYDPAAELGDYVRSGSDVASVLYSEAALLGPAFRGNISAPEPSEIADEFPYIGASAKALTEAKAFAIEKATEITDALDESLNQEGIFNRLTDNGEVQGLYLYEGKVYLNASYIQAGTLLATLIKGGTLTLGGFNDTNGVLQVLDADGNVIVALDNNGADITNGSIISYNEDKTLRTLITSGNISFQYYGQDPGSGGIGWWTYSTINLNDTGKSCDFSSPNGISIGSSPTSIVGKYERAYITINYDTGFVIENKCTGSLFADAALSLSYSDGFSFTHTYGSLGQKLTITGDYLSGVMVKVEDPLMNKTTTLNVTASGVTINGDLTVTGTIHN